MQGVCCSQPIKREMIEIYGHKIHFYKSVLFISKMCKLVTFFWIRECSDTFSFVQKMLYVYINNVVRK